MLEALKKEVFLANQNLYNKGVVIDTWGNASGLDPTTEFMVIKPSGVSYELMSPNDMVVVDINSGKVIEGAKRPSSDTKTHIELYKAFPSIKGIAHTHSVNAVAFAQAGMSIPALGTTHADYFHGDIPCTRELSEEEVRGDYEKNTGLVIVECLKKVGYDPLSIPGILVQNHGPFTWGECVLEAADNAFVLETIAEMAIKTLELNPNSSLKQYILDKHYYRKHGENAYYGQNE